MANLRDVLLAVKPHTKGIRGDVGAVVVGVVAAAVVRHGAFDPLDAILFPALLIAAAVVSGARVERRWRRPLAVVGGLAVWWLVAALGWGRPAEALPLLGSFIGFGAGAVIVSGLPDHQAAVARRLLVWGAAVFAAVGLVGVALRHYPIAMEAQGLWRLSGTLTYANAAGLLLAVLLPVALAEHRRKTAITGIAITLISGALIATMSRGALLAFVVALPLIAPLVRAAAWPLVLGALTGVTAIATASSDATQPLVLIVAAGAMALAAAPARRGGIAVLVVGGFVFLALPATRDGLTVAAERRISVTELDDRTPEWRGALRQFAGSPLIGVGPERPYVSDGPRGSELVRYAHSEPLQVAMGSGIVGLGLLAAASFQVHRVTRRGAGSLAPARWAHAGLLVFALGGVMDFSWHLPALGIVGGMMAALAAREENDQ